VRGTRRDEPTALEVLELLVDPAEKKISLLASLNLGAALLLRGFLGSHPPVGSGDPEIDVVDPARLADGNEGYILRRGRR